MSSRVTTAMGTITWRRPRNARRLAASGTRNAAPSAVLPNTTGGRFNLGVGTGEALNEYVTGAKWPTAEERQQMLEEAVTIIAELFTGEQLTYHRPQADLIKLYRVEGGGGRPVQGDIKGCWAPDAGQARTTMHRLWPNDSMRASRHSCLPLPRHFG